MPTWTAVFGFTALEESVKQEMRSMNMLVFPGIDMLQKFLLNEENTRADTGVEQTGSRSNDQITPEVANGYKPGSSSGNNTEECDDGDLHHSGLDCPAEDNRSDDGTDSRSGNKATGYASDGENLTTSTDNDAVDKENKTTSDSAIEKHTRTPEECDMEAVDAVEYVVAVSDAKTKLTVEATSEMETKIVPNSPEHNSRSSKGSDRTSNDVHQVDNVTVSNEIEARVSAKGNTLAGSESGDELAKSASPGMETKSTSDLGKDVSDSCGGE
ncbi:hypothetical protein V6N11_082503 [Hibiscus sabdariffa]|uniref:Uncharacterized protein n=1 Tax=Hibiscus sabdariffa TaxID=183260 RepID=A0ABR1Z854_9ROSI